MFGLVKKQELWDKAIELSSIELSISNMNEVLREHRNGQIDSYRASRESLAITKAILNNKNISDHMSIQLTELFTHIDLVLTTLYNTEKAIELLNN